MRTLQVQAVPSLQATPSASRQLKPVQHASADEQGCPAEAQDAGRQVPPPPELKTHARPEQQSEEAVHALASG